MKITKNNTYLIIDNDKETRTYPTEQVDTFLIDCILKLNQELEITCKQYVSLLNKYNEVMGKVKNEEREV